MANFKSTLEGFRHRCSNNCVTLVLSFSKVVTPNSCRNQQVPDLMTEQKSKSPQLDELPLESPSAALQQRTSYRVKAWNVH